MSTLEIKQQLQQFIEKSDDKSIVKFYEMVKNFIESKDEEVVTYTTNGKPLTKEQYVKYINTISNNVKNGAKTYSTKEVKNFILNS